MNTSMDHPDIDTVQTALQHVRSEADAAEVHGLQCGMLCARGELDSEAWWAQSMPEIARGDVQAMEGRELLLDLFEATRGDLNDPVLDFPLLLPDDNASIQVRVEALGHWAGGFLLGLSLGGLNDLNALPEELADFTSDLIKITRTDEFELTGSEEDEEAYTELVEFVRMGVLMFAEEVHPTKAPPRDQPLH